MKMKIFSSIKRVVEDIGRHRRWGRKQDVSPPLVEERLNSTELASASYYPNSLSKTKIVDASTMGTMPAQATFKAELEKLSQERLFNPLKALERKTEIEARYFFLQRVYEEPAMLETLLETYSEWVGRISTPQGLAAFVLMDHDGGMVGNGEEVEEGVKNLKELDML